MNDCTTALPSLPIEIIGPILSMTNVKFVDHKTREYYIASLQAETDQKIGLYGRNLILEGLYSGEYFYRNQRSVEKNIYTLCGGKEKFHQFPLIIVNRDLFRKLMCSTSSTDPIDNIPEEEWKTISERKKSEIKTQAVIRGRIKDQDSPFILMNLCHEGKSYSDRRIFYYQQENKWHISNSPFQNYCADNYLMGYNLENELKKEPKRWPDRIIFANALKQLITTGSCCIHPEPELSNQGKISLVTENIDPLK